MTGDDAENPTSVEQNLFLLDRPEEMEAATSNTMPRPLLCLYGMNGMTLALPMTALLFIVNTHVQMPLELLPTYAAVAFLPYSLKPFHGYLTQRIARPDQRHIVLGCMLSINAILVACTALIPPGGVLVCFLVAFLREFACAFADFLLGVTLVDTYCRPDSAATLQAQAATARNVGSLIAHGGAWAFFHGVREINRTSATVLLLATTVVTLASSGIALVYQVGRKSSSLLPLGASSYDGSEEDENVRDDDSAFDEMDVCEGPPSDASIPSTQSAPSSSFSNAALIILLQSTIILICLRGPIEGASSIAWNLLVWTSLVALLVTAYGKCRFFRWEATYTVGLFLILRHIIPSISFIMNSFIYEVLQNRPAFLQSLSVASMAITALSSWSYGKVSSFHSHSSNLHRVIVVTTVLAAVASLGNLAIVQWLPHLSSLKQTLLMLTVTTVTTFIDEWSFLPDVILATVSVVDRTSQGDVAMEYGSLVSCINFGDQIGALLAGPLISVIGMKRENNWQHLDVLVELCALLTFLSAGLVRMLPNDKPREGPL